MKNNHNINQIKTFFEEVFNKDNFSACSEFLADNVKFHDPAAHQHNEGLEAYKELERTYRHAFPNKKTKIDEIFGVDDRVVVRWTTHGKHERELQGIAPTNAQFKFSGISLYRLQNGKITDIWQEWDRLGLLEQIGEIQPLHALH